MYVTAVTEPRELVSYGSRVGLPENVPGTIPRLYNTDPLPFPEVMAQDQILVGGENARVLERTVHPQDGLRWVYISSCLKDAILNPTERKVSAL